jgi:hypothetical protein
MSLPRISFCGVVLFLTACAAALPGVPANEQPPGEGEERPSASSLKSCKRDDECLAHERCNYYRFCTEDDPAKCPPAKGDLHCHKNCEDGACPKGEHCREVPVAYSDQQSEARLCF